MNKLANNYQLSEGKNPILTLIVILLLSFSAFQAIGPLVGFFLILPFFDFDVMMAVDALMDPVGREGVKVPVFILQGFASLFGFIIFPIWYLRYVEKKRIHIFFNTKSLHSYPVMILTFLVLSFMFVNTIFIEWNANVELPQAFSSLEESLKSLEEAARKQSEFLTTFDNLGQFLLAVLVVAVIPAVGEELIFRGFVQQLLKQITGNIHIAIWIAGFLFSAFHLQFYGLVPRMLLGVLFGYLFYWSGSLSTAMLAHFINNCFTLVMMYLYQQNITELNVENEESLQPTFLIILIFLFLGLAFLYRQYFVKNENGDNESMKEYHS